MKRISGLLLLILLISSGCQSRNVKTYSYMLVIGGDTAARVSDIAPTADVLRQRIAYIAQKDFTFEKVAENVYLAEFKTDMDSLAVGILLTTKGDFGFYEDYPARQVPVIDYRYIEDAYAKNVKRRHYNELVIVFTKEGEAIWAEVTEKNTGKQIAVVMDGQVVSSPTVTMKIEGDKTALSSDHDLTTYQAWAVMLKTGPLKTSVEVVGSDL